MKTASRIFTVLAAVFFCAPAFAQWTALAPNNSRTFTYLSFPSNDTGYLTSQKIYRTFDGGATFDSVNPNFNQYYSIYFRITTDGVITGTTAATGSSVKRTLNAGTTWTDITPSNLIGTPADAKFCNATNGVLLTSATGFYYTTNAGVTWDTIQFGYDYFSTVSFGDAQTGYLGGFDGTFAYKGVIAKTTDGGATWNIQTNFSQAYTEIRQLQFVSADTGFADYTYFASPARLLRTRNGGSSWDTVYFTQGNIVKFAFRNGLLGFVLNDSGSIYRTVDGGVTWQLDRPAVYYLEDIDVTPSYAYACGTYGVVLKRSLAMGMEDPANELEMAAYPNPCTGRVLLEIPAAMDLKTVRALDVNGKDCGEVPWRPDGNGTVTLDVSRLKAGVYILEVIGGENVYRKRVVKVE